MKKLKLPLLTLITSFTVGMVSYAEEAAYAQLLSKLEQHPALEAVRQHVIEQREAAAGAGSLPDPMLMFGINNFPADGKGGFDRFAMTSKSVGFIQKIPNSGVRAASVQAKQHLAAKAQIAVAYTHQQLISSFHIALAEKKRITKQQQLLLEEMNLLKQEAAFWDGRLQAGESALDERSRVSADLAQAEAQQARLQAEAAEFDAELVRLVGQHSPIDVPNLILTPWPNVLRIFSVQLAEKDVHVAQANVSSAESAFGPNYQLGATYAQRDNSGSFDGGDFASVQFGISIPLWSKWNQQPKLRSAQAGVSRAKAMLADVRSRTHQQLTTQYAKIKETEATQKALHEKQHAIDTQINSLRAAYTHDGRLDKLIAAKRSLLKLRLQLAALEAQYVRQVNQFNSLFEPAEVEPVATQAIQTTKVVSATEIQSTQAGENL
ncbi:MAG: TolC family protein [Alphaproteobacteria bacterium]|nr:TolC family protein [Alphaproteobacteria bacterium]MDD9919460.1 TolC family protein [Alphaproteobacteria bacterium]